MPALLNNLKEELAHKLRVYEEFSLFAPWFARYPQLTPLDKLEEEIETLKRRIAGIHIRYK